MRRVFADRIGDPKDLLVPYEAAVSGLDISLNTVQKAKADLGAYLRGGGSRLPDQGQDAAALHRLAQSALRALNGYLNTILATGAKLFLSLIQSLALPPGLRKKVEKGSKNYAKGVQLRSKHYGLARDLDILNLYEKLYLLYTADLAVAKEAIATGKEHSEESEGATKQKVGSFTLINTGGFKPEVMSTVAEVMQKTEALIKASGLGEVCYGEVQVTNTLTKSNVLAFYLIEKDAVFVRANVKANYDTIQTVIHELGHRYQHKFLRNDQGVEKLYQILSGEEWSHKEDLRKKTPKPGDIWVSPKSKKEYRVTSVRPGRKWTDYDIHLEDVDNPKEGGKISLEGYLAAIEGHRNVDADPNYKGFVTDYAKRGGAGENFAEMFSFYCMGKLPVAQSVPFEALVFGGPEAEKFRFARRIVARYILGSLAG